MATQAREFRATKTPDAPGPARLTASSVERMISSWVMLGVGAAVVWGWLHRHDNAIDPHNGLGYALGIVGGTMMLILLGYPLRKRVRARARSAGSIGFWFRFHMLLGLVGPLAILYHARFSWGALNSAFALGAMIVVATSGLVGRFFYARVHRGYSGRKLEIRSLKGEMDDVLARLEERGLVRDTLIERMTAFEARAMAAGADFWSSAGAVIGLGIETRRAERRLLADLPHDGNSSDTALRGMVSDFFEAVRRAAEFAFYDRLLRLWHLLHMPLFILLIVAAVLHIVAVHMY
ncbi:MAG: hypothetical protein KGL48_04890 [Sphingomonadales bacterium]|nr:hypothetical protein [Sphingomonadales bacterium]MDE2568742.1 hypothetical protein [Sphingomonadales bacterium]